MALHAGTAAALLLTERRALARTLGTLDARRLAGLSLAIVPPALVGSAFEHQIARRLGTPPTIAGGLLGGALTMALADLRGARGRREEDAGPGDWLLLGLAQSCALMPGVSRTGATLTVARARGFDRPTAERLSFLCGLPVILGAIVLRARPPRRAATGPRRGVTGSLAAGALAAFLSTLAASSATGGAGAGRPLWPYAAYRTALAAVVVRRVRQNRGDGRRLRRGRS